MYLRVYTYDYDLVQYITFELFMSDISNYYDIVRLAQPFYFYIKLPLYWLNRC